jgi:hypothetical protein
MKKNSGIYCLANDNVAEWFEAFIRSLRLANPDVPVTLIPFNTKLDRLKSLQPRFHFDILHEAQCARFDVLAGRVMGSDRLAGAYRKFACFFGPYDEFLFLDSDIIVLSDLTRLLDAFAASDRDFVYFDTDLAMAYAPVLAGRMIKEYGARGFNTGAFLSRKGVVIEAQLENLAGQAAAERDGLLPGVLEQSFFNYVFDVSRRRQAGIETLLPNLADKIWARQPFFYDPKNRTALTNTGKVLPFIHWAGCGYPTMVHPEIYLEYRTLDMGTVESLTCRCKFYLRRWRRMTGNALRRAGLKK